MASDTIILIWTFLGIIALMIGLVKAYDTGDNQKCMFGSMLFIISIMMLSLSIVHYCTQ